MSLWDLISLTRDWTLAIAMKVLNLWILTIGSPGRLLNTDFSNKKNRQQSGDFWNRCFNLEGIRINFSVAYILNFRHIHTWIFMETYRGLTLNLCVSNDFIFNLFKNTILSVLKWTVISFVIISKCTYIKIEDCERWGMNWVLAFFSL